MLNLKVGGQPNEGTTSSPKKLVSALHASAHKEYLTLAVHYSMFQNILPVCVCVQGRREGSSFRREERNSQKGIMTLLGSTATPGAKEIPDSPHQEQPMYLTQLQLRPKKQLINSAWHCPLSFPFPPFLLLDQSCYSICSSTVLWLLWLDRTRHSDC